MWFKLLILPDPRIRLSCTGHYSTLFSCYVWHNLPWLRWQIDCLETCLHANGPCICGIQNRQEYHRNVILHPSLIAVVWTYAGAKIGSNLTTTASRSSSKCNRIYSANSCRRSQVTTSLAFLNIWNHTWLAWAYKRLLMELLLTIAVNTVQIVHSQSPFNLVGKNAKSKSLAWYVQMSTIQDSLTFESCDAAKIRAWVLCSCRRFCSLLPGGKDKVFSCERHPYWPVKLSALL